MVERDCESIIKSMVSPIWQTTQNSGRSKEPNALVLSLQAQDTILSGEKSTWFAITKNYQEVRSDE